MSWIFFFLWLFNDDAATQVRRTQPVARAHGNVSVETLCNKRVDCRQPSILQP